MEATKLATDAPALRNWFHRWWLLSANLLVVNAVSLHTSFGGLRTPSPAVNLWLTAAVLLTPYLRWNLRGCVRPGGLLFDNVASVLVTLLVTLLVTALAACVVGVLLFLAFVLILKAITVAPMSLWPPAAMTLIAVLLADALWTKRRPGVAAGMFATARALAWAPPTLLLTAVMLCIPIDARAWLGGVDTMFEPVARIDDGALSYVAVRSDPMAFTHPTIRVLVASPLVPGLVGWWRELGALYDVAAVRLRVDGDELCVDYVGYDAEDRERSVRQRRFRIR